MTPDTPLEDAAKGVTKGVLEWSKEQIENFLNKHRNKTLAFVEDKETLDAIEDQKSTAEWCIYKNYIKDKRLKMLVKLGLTLRQLKNAQEQNRLQDLRNKIIKRYGSNGLHVSEFVENSILSDYLLTELKIIRSPVDLIKNVEDLLNNIDKFIIFIQSTDEVRKSAEWIISYLKGSHPDIYILVGKSSAITITKKITYSIKKEVKEYYNFEIIEKSDDYIVFIRIKS